MHGHNRSVSFFTRSCLMSVENHLRNTCIISQNNFVQKLQQFDLEGTYFFCCVYIDLHVCVLLCFSLKIDLRCQHNTRHTCKPGKRTKDTKCPATMSLVLKKSIKYPRSKDPHIKAGLLFIVTLRFEHNHPLSCADVLKRKDVSEATVTKLKTLFQNGHSPSSALDMIKYDLQEEHGDQYVYVSADRSILPDPQFCYRLYYKVFEQAYGPASGEAMFVDLENRIHLYNEEQHQTCAKIEQTSDDQTVIAICTPLMKRAHETIKHSGELVFVDSSGNCDRHNSRIFVMLTHSSAGGVPLGIIVATSESQSTVTAGFKLLKSILPDGAFYGRGEDGPQVIMTDDCKALRQGLHAVYPDAALILCIFHLLQAMWRWLWDAHSGIPKQNRPYLLQLFKRMVYADTTVELEVQHNHLLNDEIVHKYPKFLAHVDTVYQRREAWADCLQKELPIRGNRTNNFVESSMRVIKEKVFMRLKAFNVTQTVHFLYTRLEAYYIRRLMDVANNRMANPSQSKYNADDGDVNLDNIVKEGDTSFTVPSRSSERLYHVDITLGTCTCPIGITGGPCKHQSAVMNKFNIESTNFLPTCSPNLRKMYYFIATGRPELEIVVHWFLTGVYQSIRHVFYVWD
ncbi:uncharacterized protein LOC121426833 isoform X1 [Lytechinus variegatus]|uniref:uncharacterized protein LOC121426833 isoform X1 n=1 Tax=Lytechinus variegatus TaxID=7654 RepID=UPI001BB17C21|nr:uncharacterized protein LOC121426833 isoform X1 [Lytechinus variegatus]